MSKIQINKGDLLRIVESTIRAIINEGAVVPDGQKIGSKDGDVIVYGGARLSI